MNQSRLMSGVESATNLVAGYLVAVVSQIVVLPWFGVHTSIAQNFGLAAVFGIVSFVRSYFLRRIFEGIKN